MIALQFFAVALPAVLGLVFVGSTCVTAWNPRVAGNNLTVIVTGTVAVAVLSVSVLLASLFGWLPIG
jgi:hypothetical protein